MTDLRYHIPEPCDQRWHTMTPVAGGRHCANCQHVVVDFTGRTDKQITAFLTKHDGSRVCGRISTSQLRPPNRAAKRERTLWSQIQRLAAVVVMACGLSNSRALAQEQPAPPPSHMVPAIPLPILSSTPVYPDTLRGRIVDDEVGEGLPGATVMIEGTTIGTATDFDGNFSLPLDSLSDPSSTLVIVASFVGYETRQVALRLSDVRQPLVFHLSAGMLLGEVIAHGPYEDSYGHLHTGAVLPGAPMIVKRSWKWLSRRVAGSR